MSDYLKKRQVTARSNAQINLALRQGKTSGEKRSTAGLNRAHQGTDHQLIAKIDRENEVAPPPKVSSSVGEAMSKARMEKGLTQKDVAQKINEKPVVVQDYESGKAIPNAQILAKLERLLGVKLRGANIGAPLEGKKKKTLSGPNIGPSIDAKAEKKEKIT